MSYQKKNHWEIRILNHKRLSDVKMPTMMHNGNAQEYQSILIM